MHHEQRRPVIVTFQIPSHPFPRRLVKHGSPFDAIGTPIQRREKKMHAAIVEAELERTEDLLDCTYFKASSLVQPFLSIKYAVTTSPLRLTP